MMGGWQLGSNGRQLKALVGVSISAQASVGFRLSLDYHHLKENSQSPS